MPISLNDQVAHPNLMWPTPRANNIVNKKERLTPEGRLSKDGKQMRKKVDAGEVTKEEAEKMLGGSLNPKRMKHWTPKNGRK